MKVDIDNERKLGRQIICIHCSIHENGERFPFIARKEIEGVINDNNATLQNSQRSSIWERNNNVWHNARFIKEEWEQ